MSHPGNAIDVLSADHREVKEMFAQLEGLPSGDPRRREVLDRVTIELVKHSVAEEEYLYPATRDFLPDGDQLADHEIEEHAEVERLLKDLEALDVTDPEFDVKLSRMMVDVRHHIEEEEGELFPRLAAAAGPGRLNELGDKIRMAKKFAPTRPHPTAPDTPPWDKLLAPGAGFVDRIRDALSGRGR